MRLYNRVRQLQKEESKAHKRIQETNNRAKEIIALRERNERAQLEKEARLQELQQEIERQKMENTRLRDDVLRNRTEQEAKIWAEKVALAEEAREKRLEIERQIADEKVLSRKEALEQREVVRRAEEEARQKLEQLRLSKMQLVRGFSLSNIHSPTCTPVAPNSAAFSVCAGESTVILQPSG